MCIRDRSCCGMHAITASSTPKPYEYTKRSTRSLVDPLLSMAVVVVPIEFREGTGRLRRTGLSRHAPRCLSKTRVPRRRTSVAVSYTHLRAHETPEHLVCRL